MAPITVRATRLMPCGPGAGWTLELFESPVSDGEGRDLFYAVNDGAGWTIEAVDPPGRGFIFCVCRQMPNRLRGRCSCGDGPTVL
jgi:hypothetical protein